MTATLVTLDDSVRASASGSTTPDRSTGSSRASMPALAAGPGGLAHGRVLHGGAQDHGLAPLLPGRLGRPEHGQVGGLGAAGGEDDLARIAAEEGGHLLARLLEQAPRPLGRRVAAGRVPEQDRRPASAVHLGHGGGHLGPQRRRGGVVEVGDGAHGARAVMGSRRHAM